MALSSRSLRSSTVTERASARASDKGSSRTHTHAIVPTARHRGTVLASSRGVAVTPGGSGAEGAWTEIVASTSNAYTGLLWSIQGNTSGVQAGSHLVDIGTGASLSEVAVMSDYMFSSSGSEILALTSISPINVSIPAGTRLAARIQSSGTASGYAVSLFGLR